MDRRNKIWLVVLALLLVAAVVSVVVVNGRLENSKQQLAAANVELSGEQERNAALSADYESVSAELTTAQENQTALETQLTQAQEDRTSLEGQLTEAQEARTALETQLTQAQENQSALETELTAAQEAKTALETQLTQAQENQSALETELTAAQENQTTLKAQLTEAEGSQTLLKLQLAAAQEEKTSLENQLAEAQNALEDHLANASSVEPEVETQEAEAAGASEEAEAVDVTEEANAADVTTEAETADTPEEAPQTVANARESYDMLSAEEASNAYSERVGRLDESEAKARERVEAFSGVLDAVRNGIAGLGGTPAEAPVVGASESESAPVPEVPEGETEAASERMLLIPEVYEPAYLAETANVSADEIQAKVDAILNAGEDSMTPEEKIAALEELQSEVGGYVEGLNAALDDISAQRAVLTTSMSGMSAMENELQSALTSVEELNAAAMESAEKVAGLETQLAELTGKGEADAAEIEALNAQIAAEQAHAAELNEQLSAMQAERDKYLAALNAYRIERAPSDGEAHAASSMGSSIAVAANGTSATWRYVNLTVSGNPVVLRIEMDGEELYRSEVIAPGEALESFELNQALPSGSYRAAALVSVSDADGSVVSTTRIPVSIVVE